MDKKSRQEALNNISDADLAKVKAHQASTEGAFPVDQEWLLLAEFAKAYGWQAYLDVKHDNIKNVTFPEMLTLIEANRKLEAGELLRTLRAVFSGVLATKAKKPVQAFKKLAEDIIKRTKVQE